MATAQPLMITREVGSEGHRRAREYIEETLRMSGFKVMFDAFKEETPIGHMLFTNVVGTINENAPHRLVLAAHYDSKHFPDMQFIGATDSAIPCAILLQIAKILGPRLAESTLDTGLQLIFFDGEEAFREWSHADSLYGSRHLAARMAKEIHGSHTALKAISLFVLLDLLGSSSPHPQIHNYFASTTDAEYQHMADVETRLHKAGQLRQHNFPYFQRGESPGRIEDDYVPFLKRGVPIVHVIPAPFPNVWHRADDNADNVDYIVAQNFADIVLVFTAEYLNIKPDSKPQ
jgi:glutaminyl-peptide cyclotransferase